MGNPIKMDDLGVPPFMETPMSNNPNFAIIKPPFPTSISWIHHLVCHCRCWIVETPKNVVGSLLRNRSGSWVHTRLVIVTNQLFFADPHDPPSLENELFRQNTPKPSKTNCSTGVLTVQSTRFSGIPLNTAIFNVVLHGTPEILQANVVRLQLVQIQARCIKAYMPRLRWVTTWDCKQCGVPQPSLFVDVYPPSVDLPQAKIDKIRHTEWFQPTCLSIGPQIAHESARLERINIMWVWRSKVLGKKSQHKINWLLGGSSHLISG